MKTDKLELITIFHFTGIKKIIKKCFMPLFFYLSFQMIVGGTMLAQNIGINSTGATPDASAMLDIVATDKGLLIPRVALTATNAAGPITAPQTTLLVYNTTTAGTAPTNVIPGFYYNAGTTASPNWVRLLMQTSGWSTTGNAGTVDGTNFIGTTDNIPFNIRVNNNKAGRIDNTLANTFFGYHAGNANTTGTGNTGTGYRALASNTTGVDNTAFGTEALYLNISGTANTAIGQQALRSNTGNNNTAIGENSLFANTSGNNNTATGYHTLTANTTGYNNSATGVNALFSNTTGYANTATGMQALLYNTIGYNNTAIGVNAVYSNTTGYNNTAAGWNALYTNTTGYNNSAIGVSTLFSNTIGHNNTASGIHALFYNTEGTNNTATGYRAIYSNTTGYNNSAIGVNAIYSNTTGYNNTAAGRNALYTNTTGYHNTAIGVNALFYNTEGLENTVTGMDALTFNTSGNNNTATGVKALHYNTTGSNNVALGFSAGIGTSGINFTQCTFVGSNSYPAVNRTNVTMLGYGIVNAQCTGDNQVCVGNTSIGAGGLRAAVTGWTAYSDARFKTNVKDNVVGLDFILKLKPVTYNVRPAELHKIWGTPDSVLCKMNFSETEKEIRIGLLAQDVEKAARESGFNFTGIDIPRNPSEVYTLRYVDFIMPMIKGIQELNAKNDSLQKENQEIKSQLFMLSTQLGTLESEYNSRLKTLEAIMGMKAQK